MAYVLSVFVDHNSSGKNSFDVWILLEKIAHLVQRTRKILLITIQMSEDVALGEAVTAVYGIVHARIFFDKCADTPVVRQPIPRGIIRACVLNDMFEFHASLISYGGDAQLEPFGMSKAGSDNGKQHGSLLIGEESQIQRQCKSPFVEPKLETIAPHEQRPYLLRPSG